MTTPTPPTQTPPPPFVFVVGSARSGTTLVRSLLDSHPQLAIPSESYFVLGMAGRDFAPKTFLDDLAAHPRFREWSLGREVVAAELRRAEATTYPDAIRAVFRCYAASQGKPRYGDKTPGYVFNLPLLDQLFPEARIVHVVRDGRDVAVSMRATHPSHTTHANPPSTEQMARLWRKAVTKGRAFGTANPTRYAELRYEDLIDDAEGELRRICPPLELDFDAAMLDHRASAERLLGSVDFAHLHARLLEAPLRRLRDWTVEMIPEDVAAFEAAAGDALRLFGYPTAPVPLRRRLEAAGRSAARTWRSRRPTA